MNGDFSAASYASSVMQITGAEGGHDVLSLTHRKRKAVMELDTAAVLQSTSEKMRAEGFQVRESHF